MSSRIHRIPKSALSPSTASRPLHLLALFSLLGIPAARSFAAEATSNVASADALGENVQLDRFEVSERLDAGAASLQAAKAVLTDIPGTSSIVNFSDVQRGRAVNAADLLAYQPGVFAEATSGNSANKISIRGSGLNTFYQGYSLGTKYLYDGQPITGPGGTQEELLKVTSPSYIEILNGPNAFSYASTSRGGAINFVSQNGRTSPGLNVRIEGGSFGYRRGEISYGGVQRNLDYFVSAYSDQRSGFQTNTPNKSSAALLNFGYRFNKQLETRLIIRAQREELRNGATLTKAQIDADPSQNNAVGLAQPNNPDPLKRSAQNARLKPNTTVVSSKTVYTFANDSKLELGLSNTNYPLRNGWLYSNTPQDWRSDDFNVTLRYSRNDEIFGLTSKTTVIASDTVALFADVNGYADPRNGTPRILTQFTDYTGSRDTVFAASNELEVFKNLFWVSAGISYVEIRRNVQIKYTSLTTANPLGFPRNVDYVDSNVLPRFGARFKIAPDLELFGNISKAVDGPVTWQIGSTGSSYSRPLQPQEATTIEAGIKGKWKLFEGTLTVYRASLRNELLTIRISNDPTVLPINANSSPSTHQGVEAGLTANLWQSSRGDRVSLRQSFAFNDFYFRNDPSWGHNELPSLPRQYYQAELLYHHAKGYYASVNVRAASSYYIDFANSVKADPYALLGTTVGFETDRWRLFVDLKNLTDEHYATAANTVFNAGGNAATAANFYPGDTFNFIAGVSYHF